MIIAIHNSPGSYSDRWIDYCIKNNIQYKIINCYQSDIIKDLKGCDGLMWHWDHNDYRNKLFAKQLTLALNNLNIKLFPDINSSWHFDDKVGQKYLFEAIDASTVPSYVFYNKYEAFRWAESTSFPKVFKLRIGAGSVNVRLVKNKKVAKSIIKKAFSKGFSHCNLIASFKDRIQKFKRQKNLKNLIHVLKGIARFFLHTEEEKMSGKQKGYVYFQDFIPDNKYDTRLFIIGNRCFGMRRFNRKNDFRASGSGLLSYKRDFIDHECIKQSFQLAKKLKTQSLALDFLKQDNTYKLTEISYCFPAFRLYDAPGFWDNNLVWHDVKVIPEYCIIEDFINSINEL